MVQFEYTPCKDPCLRIFVIHNFCDLCFKVGRKGMQQWLLFILDAKALMESPSFLVVATLYILQNVCRLEEKTIKNEQIKFQLMSGVFFFCNQYMIKNRKKTSVKQRNSK